MTEDEIKNKLTEEEYRVLRKQGTERPFTGELLKEDRDGDFRCKVCDTVLFKSDTKFDSGTGWPSFVKPISDTAVTLHEDKKLFSTRTEVRSRYADSHLGHVFGDGPADHGGMRYCMNGAALRFIPQADMEATGYGLWLSAV
jgi:methionine-R-sulfoxide reductase